MRTNVGKTETRLAETCCDSVRTPRSSDNRGEISQWSWPKMVFSTSAMSKPRVGRGKPMCMIRSPAVF